MTSIYDLPKDLLIVLITKIESNTKTEIYSNPIKAYPCAYCSVVYHESYYYSIGWKDERDPICKECKERIDSFCSGWKLQRKEATDFKK